MRTLEPCPIFRACSPLGENLQRVSRRLRSALRACATCRQSGECDLQQRSVEIIREAACDALRLPGGLHG